MTYNISNYKYNLKKQTHFHTLFLFQFSAQSTSTISLLLTNHTMLLRTSISKYKKFFQKTLTNFKSLFSPTYQKIPKTPLHNNPSYNDLEKFYNDFTKKWDSENRKTKKRSKKKRMLSSSTTTTKQEEEEVHLHNHNHNEMEKKQDQDFEEKKNKRKLSHIQRGKKQDSSSSSSTSNCKSIVEKKMKELEMLETSNMDYILDIEEVLHYYTKLTCPSYVEIVDKFFMEMYSEFLDCPKTPVSVNSKLEKID